MHTRYAPVRRSSASNPKIRPVTPRLACIKPAASVHPEPGSNSPLYKIICICWTRYPHLIPKLDALLSGSLQYVFKNEFFSSFSKTIIHHFGTAKVVLISSWQTFFCFFLEVFFPPYFCFQNPVNMSRTILAEISTFKWTAKVVLISSLQTFFLLFLKFF